MSLMTVGIGVFKKKICTLVTTHAYCSTRKKEVRLYSFSAYNTNYIYTCNSLCTKTITSYKKINLHSHILWKYSIKQLLVSFLFKLQLPKRIFIAIEDSLLILHKVLHYLNVRKKTYCVEWNITPYNEVPNYIFVRC